MLSTQEDLLRLGREVLTDPTFTGWTRQGRPIRNLEMHAVMCVTQQDRRIRRHETGCCGLSPTHNGRCPDGGVCHREDPCELFNQLAARWCQRLVTFLELQGEIL